MVRSILLPLPWSPPGMTDRLDCRLRPISWNRSASVPGKSTLGNCTVGRPLLFTLLVCPVLPAVPALADLPLAACAGTVLALCWPAAAVNWSLYWTSISKSNLRPSAVVMVPLPRKWVLSVSCTAAASVLPLGPVLCCTAAPRLDCASRLTESNEMVAPLPASPNRFWAKLPSRLWARSTVALPSEDRRFSRSMPLLDSEMALSPTGAPDVGTRGGRASACGWAAGYACAGNVRAPSAEMLDMAVS